MTDKPLPEADKLPEDEAEERFRRTLRNLVNTPHKPHKPQAVAPSRKPKGLGPAG